MGLAEPAAAGPLLAAEGGLDTDDRAVRWRALVLLGSIALSCIGSLVLASVCSQAYPEVLGHAVLAFVLGLRHAVDCDHLAAIDNVTRQLVLLGQRPISVGFWFALGHSTVVALLTSVLAGGYSAVWQQSGMGVVKNGLVLVAGLLSVGLLGGIGLLNAKVAIGLFYDWSGLRQHTAWLQDQALESNAKASLRTALSALPCLKRLFNRVDRPAKMYLVGVLFGLSFDTATQIGLIALSTISGTSGRVPPALVLIFPLCFSCGMCLVDTANGLLMLFTYSWATIRPMQKLFYNLLVTAMSASVALSIGSLEMMQIIGREAGLRGGLWTWIQGVDMGTLGCGIIAAFVAVFGTAACCAHAAGSEAGGCAEEGGTF